MALMHVMKDGTWSLVIGFVNPIHTQD